MTDYAALAAKAESDHAAANVRYGEAVKDSQMAAFRELVFHAAAADVATVNLEPSDQGDWMSITGYVDADGQEPEEDIEEALDQGAMDLPDTMHSYWAVLPGVAYDDSKRRGGNATIDIKVAAEALLAAPEPSKLQQHIEAICAEAGLGVMVQVFEIISDREDVEESTLMALDADDVNNYYVHIAKGIDTIERDLLNDEKDARIIRKHDTN